MKYPTVTLLSSLFIILTASAKPTIQDEENVSENLESVSELKQIKLELSICEIDAAGKEIVLSRPTLYTKEGSEAVISWDEKNGNEAKIKVIASRIIESKQMILRFTVMGMDAAGKESVLSHPTIHVEEGAEAEILLEQKHGKSMQIKVAASTIAEKKQD